MRLALLIALAGIAAAAAAGAVDHGPPAAAACAGTCSPATLAGARLDALADVARRIYVQEQHGGVGHAAAKRIARDRRLVAALRAGDRRAVRAEALRQLFMPGKHVVRLRVLLAGRALADVGGRFVVAGPRQRVRGVRGAAIELSMQDLVGFAKLTHRLTGLAVVVRDSTGHAVASPAAALAAPRARSGPVNLRGRSYLVRTLRLRAFGGGSATAWLLAPVAG